MYRKSLTREAILVPLKGLIKALGLRSVAVTMVKALYLVTALIETPIWLVRHRSLFKNKIVQVFWIGSFGNSVIAMDYSSRLFYPHRVSVIYLSHVRSNRMLSRCFEENLDAFVFESPFLPRSEHFDGIRESVVKGYVLLFSIFSRAHQIVDHQLLMSKTIAITPVPIKIGYEQTGYIDEVIYSGYLRLIRDNIGPSPRLPLELREQCRSAILAELPGFFDKPFMTMLLRRKGAHSTFDDETRSAGPHQNYTAAVKYAVEHGYTVVGTGETEHKWFEEISGYVNLNNVKMPAPLLNLFLLTECAMFVGQQSGTYVLPNSNGIRCLICDAFPYRLGTFSSQDIVLFKRLRFRDTGRLLSLREIYVKHPQLAYGCGFSNLGVEVLPNRSQEILASMQESIERMNGRASTEEDQVLMAQFQKSLPVDVLLRYTASQVPTFMLREDAGATD